MKVLLLNNTERYHAGCQQVINFFRHHFAGHDLTIKDKPKDISQFDYVILNGEGTMHHDRGKHFLSTLNQAKQLNKLTAIVNTVWQNNSIEQTLKLTDIDYISVREIKSKTEILNHIPEKKIDVNIDLSYFNNIPYKQTKTYKIVTGNRFSLTPHNLIKDVGEDGNIDIFSETWETIVNKLRHTNLLITGRHHEMYAACKAKCPFIVLEGNTHKNSGLMSTFNVNLPVLSRNASNDQIIKTITTINDYREQFDMLFHKMEMCTPPTFYSLNS